MVQVTGTDGPSMLISAVRAILHAHGDARAHFVNTSSDEEVATFLQEWCEVCMKHNAASQAEEYVGTASLDDIVLACAVVRKAIENWDGELG